MMAEALILRVDECIPEVWADLFISNRCAVLAEILSYHNTVSTIYL